jgi:hypothetical protein
VVESIVTPPIADQVGELVRQEENFVREGRVQRGETVAALLERPADAAAATFIRTDPSAAAAQLALAACAGEHQRTGAD